MGARRDARAPATTSPDTARLRRTARSSFRDHGTLPGGAAHDYTALVAASRARRRRDRPRPSAARSPARVCQPTATSRCPSACDDGPFGKGAGGAAALPRHGARAAARDAVGRGRRLRPGAPTRADRARRRAAATRPRSWRPRSPRARRSPTARASTCPATAARRTRSSGASRTSPTSRRRATNLQIRFVDRGQGVPGRRSAPSPRATFFGAGYPDYPWMFATDGEYTAFAAVALGQFEAIKAHLRALRDVSRHPQRRAPARSRTRSSPTARSASAPTPTPGNTDETVKFPSAVALVWRWTGDDRFRDELYDFAKRNLHYVADNLDADKRRLARGPRQRRARRAWAQEKLDNAVYYIRGLYDLADMARSKRDAATRRGRTGIADRPARTLRRAPGGTPAVEPVRRLARRDQRAGPAEALDRRDADGGRADARRPPSGLAPCEHGADRARRARDATATAARGRSTSACSTPAAAAARRARASATIFSLNTAIQAVGEGNYGRRPAQRYTDANAEPMFSEPATGGTPDEQPGALPEILPSPDFGTRRQRHEHRPLLDLPLDVHAGLGPVRHRLAGHPPAARRAAGRWARAGWPSSRSVPARPAARAGRRHPARRRLGLACGPRTRRRYTTTVAARAASTRASSPSAPRCRAAPQVRGVAAGRQKHPPGDARRPTAASRSRSPGARAGATW